jgi:hypothetical protein
VVAGAGRRGGEGGVVAPWPREVKFGQMILEVIMETTAASFLLFQVYFFRGCPPNIILQGYFRGHGC